MTPPGADLFEGPELLDPMLTGAIGLPDAFSLTAIAGLCSDAVRVVIGDAIAEDLAADRTHLWVVVPWVKDLARGLQLRSISGPADVQTTELVRVLGRGRVGELDLEQFAASIDVASALHLGDVLEHVLGPGAAGRLPGENEARLPWIEALKLGYRVHLVLEFLRLLPSSS